MQVLVLLFYCILAPASGLAYFATGQIDLQVKDPSGTPTEAQGVLEDLATGASSEFRTDAQGRHTFTNLAFGRYRLHVTKSGFAPQTIAVDVRSDTAIARTVDLAPVSPAFQVEIVGTTPLPGVHRSVEEIPGAVQAATGQDIQQSGALDLSDFLNRRLAGVYLNEIQGNPMQPDLNYRGYTASPLLGTPQGISVYMDGVRLNQPFGDVMSWDLVPRIAIDNVSLISGSNPLYGLNTLGGAVALETKDGRTHPGTSIGFTGGSFGRKMADLEHGGSNAKGLNWYLASQLFFEDGWRESSPSNVRQFFGTLGWQGEKTVLGFSATYANNHLLGNGLQEQTLLRRDYNSVYTKPDVTANRSPLLILKGRHTPNTNLTLSGNVYFRYIRTTTLNGDINEDALDQAVYQPNAAERAALAEAGYTGFPTAGETAANTPFPSWRCIAQSLLRDEPAEKCNGLLNRSAARQYNYGLSGQMSWFAAPGGTRNQFTLGGVYDRNRVDFLQSTQLGYLNPDRSVTGVPSFADGVTGGDEDGVPFDARVDLHGRISTGSVFATDTLSVGNVWNFVLSGRYNRTTVDNYDRIRPVAGSGSLTSYNVFDRFNPAAGVTFRAPAGLSLFAGYSEGNRAPTAIELGCADPEQPCKLPNAMAGDPPLRQVVTRTFEAGVRGSSENNLRWNLGWFRADNRNDILFVASEQTGYGYFKNFGKTRRQGLDINVLTRIRRLNLGGSYTFVNATFQSPEQVNGAGNSTNEEALEGIPGVEGSISITRGNRIPLVPQHMLKAYTDVQITSRLLANVGLVAMSSSYARGNENNLHQADGQYYIGPGQSPGYAVVNLGARYQLRRQLELFGQVNNLFDRQYYTAAQLAATGFTAEGAFVARPFPAVDDEYPLRNPTFFAPGAPRGAWMGIRARF